MRKELVFLLLMLIVSCKNDKIKSIDISNINVELEVSRFEVDFYNTKEQDFLNVKKKYPMLFPHDIDSIWVNKIKNKEEQELYKETQKIYQDFSKQKKKLEKLFKYIKYYNSAFKAPKIITLVTNMDSRIIYANDLLFVSLDNFLGENHRFYASFPKYIKQNNTSNHLIVDVATEIINQQVPLNIQRRFIDKMIHEGKKMYLLDVYLPNENDKEKMGCSKDKLTWVNTNEEQIWKYFIDKNLLYSTDSKLSKRFLEPAPFSKFYTNEDSQSPGRVGAYIGWQIVKAFMDNNDVSLQELVKKSSEEILKKSRYKPRK